MEKKMIGSASALSKIRMNLPTTNKTLVFVDGPDPDNLVLTQAACRSLGMQNMLGMVLTGRPFKANATPATPKEVWSESQSRHIQRLVAGRFYDYLQINGYEVPIFDGGISPLTLVPHHKHYKEYSTRLFREGRFDPATAGMESESKLSELAKLLNALGDEPFHVLVGGPMTGLKLLLERKPQLIHRIVSVHAMYGALGTVELQEIEKGVVRSDKNQFNVYCDPYAGAQVLKSLIRVGIPTFLIPSDYTRHSTLGFKGMSDLASVLPGNTIGRRYLHALYEDWDKEVLQKQGKEEIFIHDFSAMLSLFSLLSEGNDFYDFQQNEVTHFPHDFDEFERFGEIDFEPTDSGSLFISKGLKMDREKYRKFLRDWV